jgi:putative transcriptional regulator
MQTKIRQYREQQGITQETLAEKADVTRQTILILEKGKYNPSLRLAWKITKLLKANKIEDIFSFDDELDTNTET